MTPREALLKALANVPKSKIHETVRDPRVKGKLLRGKFDPRWIMVHHTAGKDSLFILKSGYGHPPVPGSHYLIARDGTVHLITVEQCYHAGKGKGFGVPENLMNPYAVGIEVESMGLAQDFTPEQKSALGGLIAGLLDNLGLGKDRVINHKDWSTTGKVDTRYSQAQILEWVDAYRASKTKVTVTKPSPTQLRKGERTIAAGRWVSLDRLDLPKVAGHRWIVTLQIRMPRGVTGGEARIARIGWGAEAAANGGVDYTGHNSIAPRSAIQWWRTPIHHEMAGGGPIQVQVYLFGSGDKAVKYVAKATLVKVGS